MEFSNSYFEDEVREGFYIPSMVKRAWAAELTVFHELDRICRKHGINYYADWGTLLGAVRHHGFVPWDDDFDIAMHRSDYEHFLRVAEKELPEGYRIFNYKNHDDFWYFLARIVAKPRICFEEEHLKRFYGFPYIVGIDIFIMDSIAPDSEQEKQRVSIVKYLLAVADRIGTSEMRGMQLQNELMRVESLCNVKIRNPQNEHQLKVQLYELVEAQCARFNNAGTQMMTQFIPCGLDNYWISKEYFEKRIRLPFEDTSIPVPLAYEAVLNWKYGDYMRSVRNTGGHNYPFFMTQRKQLEEVLDFEIPEFRFLSEMLQRKPADTQNSLKTMAGEAIRELEGFSEQLSQVFKEGDLSSASAVLENTQQLAIDLGTLIEQVRGEGLETVAFLEQYCEALYHLHTELTEANGEMSRTPEAPLAKRPQQFNAPSEGHQTILEQAAACMKREILDRKEIVFLPFKAAYWDAMAAMYQAAVEDPDCDVYVIPIPYYDKDFMGNFTVMHLETELFPKELSVMPYDQFDFALHHPDKIVIQCPYDEHNPAISVHTFFYSRNLQQYTDTLVYIPYFTLKEFDKEEVRAYGNMRYYCTMPGVIYADEVIVQSENMRKLYIEKLTEFAGEETRCIWEQKISGSGSLKQDGEQEYALLKKWHRVINKPDGSRKKLLLYGTYFGEFVEFKEQAILKLQSVFSLMEKRKEEMVLLWYAESILPEEMLQDIDERWRIYQDIVEQYRKKDWIIVLENIEEAKQAVLLCDGYYGCGGWLAYQCVVAEKPVMIRNMDIINEPDEGSE